MTFTEADHQKYAEKVEAHDDLLVTLAQELKQLSDRVQELAGVNPESIADAAGHAGSLMVGGQLEELEKRVIVLEHGSPEAAAEHIAARFGTDDQADEASDGTENPV